MKVATIKTKGLNSWIVIGALLSLVTVVYADSVSFQEGDLRNDGTLVDGSYITQAASLKKNSADTVQTSASMYIGTTTTTMRGLFAYDLSYLESQGLTDIQSVTFNLTTRTSQSNAGSTTFDAVLTDGGFDESTATWNTPGGTHAAGGNVGSTLSGSGLTTTIGSTIGDTLSFSGTAWITAVENALAGDNMLYFMVKRRAEVEGINSYLFRPYDDAATGTGTPDRRPELLINAIPEPASMLLISLGSGAFLMVRRLFLI